MASAEAKPGSAGPGREREVPRIVFVAAGAVYAVDLARVAEIIEPERWTGLPRRAPWIEGLLYHHGEALAILNAGALLEGKPTARGGASCVVRLNDATQRIGLLVDRVVGTWRKGSAEAPRAGAPFVAGVWERGGRIVNLLDVGALVERAAKIFEGQPSTEENPWPSGY
jgi:purine-binding chemotaxis protein CheW